MKNTVNKLVEGLERLGCMAQTIRKNGDSVSELEIDVLLEELRELYRLAVDSKIEQSKMTIDNSAVAKKAAEEAAEEAAAKRAAEEAAAKRAAEEAAARRAAEEAAAKKAAEEAAAKRAAEEAAARRAAEEAVAKKAAEEAAAKRAAEEAAARRAAEAAAAKKAAEEAAAKRAAEEAAARKVAEEAARKAAESDLPLFAPDERPEVKHTVTTSAMETIEGNANDTLFADLPEKESTVTGKTSSKGASLFSYLGESKEEKPSVRTLADTLNRPGRNVEEQLERKVNAKKIDDLRAIININDKFSFMSELFNNNMKAYNDFIMRLNSYSDRAQALEYVKEVATQYGWNSESLVVKSFYKIFDRKF